MNKIAEMTIVMILIQMIATLIAPIPIVMILIQIIAILIVPIAFSLVVGAATARIALSPVRMWLGVPTVRLRESPLWSAGPNTVTFRAIVTIAATSVKSTFQKKTCRSRRSGPDAA